MSVDASTHPIVIDVWEHTVPRQKTWSELILALFVKQEVEYVSCVHEILLPLWENKEVQFHLSKLEKANKRLIRHKEYKNSVEKYESRKVRLSAVENEISELSQRKQILTQYLDLVVKERYDDVRNDIDEVQTEIVFKKEEMCHHEDTLDRMSFHIANPTYCQMLAMRETENRIEDCNAKLIFLYNRLQKLNSRGNAFNKKFQEEIETESSLKSIREEKERLVHFLSSGEPTKEGQLTLEEIRRLEEYCKRKLGNLKELCEYFCRSCFLRFNFKEENFKGFVLELVEASQKKYNQHLEKHLKRNLV